MPGDRAAHTATTLVDGMVLFVGGIADNEAALDSADVFDPLSGTFASVGPMTAPRAGGHSAVLSHDGRVLVLGGWGTDQPSATAELFDPATRSFRQRER